MRTVGPSPSRRAALLLAGALLLSPSAQAGDPPRAPPASAASVDPDTARRAAAELWKAADDARRRACFGEARRQAERVLGLDPDHRGARALLGFARKGDAWVEDPALAARTPATDLPDAKPRSDRRPALREWRHEVLRPAERRAADLYAALAAKLEKSGDAGGARAARLAALALVPDHEAVRKALGETRWKDLWLPADGVRAAETARAAKETADTSDLGALVGGGLTRVETARCVFLGKVPAARLTEWAQACEDVMSLLFADLGRDPGTAPVSTKLRFVVCTAPAQWERWVEGTQTPENQEFYRTLYGVWGPEWSYGVRRDPRAAGDRDAETRIRDHVVHRAAHWAVTQSFGVPWMSWLDEGLVHHYVFRSEGRAATWCANPAEGGYEALRGDERGDGWTGPGEWRDLVWRMVVGEDVIPFRALGLTKIHEQPPAAAVQAWSVVSWWRATDALGLRRFLATIRGTGDVTKSVEAARGKPVEEVERDWRQWVLVD